MRLDPNTPPIGRQPERVYITPSKPAPWYGAIAEGERFTLQQQRKLMELGRDVPTAEAITVKRQATDREMWTPLGKLPAVFAFECPVIGRRADGKIKVIAPSGEAKFILPDGWAHRPKTRPYLGGF